MASLSAWGQELKLDVLLGTNVFAYTNLNFDSYAPANSYFIYKGSVTKYTALNSFRSGISVGLELRKLSVNLEPQFVYERTQIVFPLIFEIERIHVTKGFSLPIILSYKFFKKKNSLSLISGIVLNKFNGYDFQSPGAPYLFGSDEPYSEVLNVGPNQFDGKLYTDRTLLNYTVGLGRNFGNWNHSIRFMNKFPFEQHKVEANTFQFTYTVRLNILSSKDLTNRHFLYEE
jgi:hypothetical protein